MQYMIPQIAAITIIVNGRRTADGWQIMLDGQDPSCRYMVERTLQDDCPIFYQAIAALGDLGMTPDKTDQNALSEVFVYIDFQNIFGVTSNKKRLELAEMTESFFRPEGLVINYGRGDNRYVAFERSANMSRDCRLAFVREDVYAPLKERMQLGMEIGECQLSKLYAYNGLMFTTGERVEYEDFSYKDNIIVIDNPVYVVKNVDQVTVADDGSDGPMRTYHRVEQTADIEVMGFDGEGLISPYAAKVLNIHGEHHHSFQIRLPYIKGMVHEVDFEGLLKEVGVTHIVDCWGRRHPVGLVHIILTKSMFKGFGWMEQNGLSWEEYRQRWARYDHGLYVSGADKAGSQGTVCFNYQFLNTLQMDAETFRPLDLPLGWKKSPRTDPRTWLTKTTETAYYDLVAVPDVRKEYFLSRISDEPWTDRDPRNTRFKLIRQNERFIDEPCFAKELSVQAKALLRHYSLGQLLVSGDNRYLSDDLMRLLMHMVETSVGRTAAYDAMRRECLQGNTIYAPAPAYPVQERYLLLRSPHIARNEEVSAVPLKDVGPLRERYLSHLRYVVMIDSRALIAERLGGADYDGDYVKTIAEPLLVNCVDPRNDLPVLKIPAAKPLYADANDWQARMETVKSTFSSRVGQVSNEALRRGLIAYDETDEGDLQEEYALDTELLAILIGLEIDSSKSGVKPDLRDYLGFNKAPTSLFLRYKSILKQGEKRKWYEETMQKRMKDFFASVEWEDVTANLERVPYLAYMLERETPCLQPSPAEDGVLFSFAQEPRWKEGLDPQKIQRMEAILSAYDTALGRCRAVQYGSHEFTRKSDVDRILYAQAKDGDHISDELYRLFDDTPPEQIHEARIWLGEVQWHLLPPEERKPKLYALRTRAPLYVPEYAELFCDFRNGGYRLLGDIICDLDDFYRKEKDPSRLYRVTDPKELRDMLRDVDRFRSPKEGVLRNCHAQLVFSRDPDRFTVQEIVQYALALGRRDFLLACFPDLVLRMITPESEPKPKKKRKWRWLGG